MNKLEQRLKKNNLRLTNPRKVIFNILDKSSIALSPKDVCDEMFASEKLKADQASVYRNLLLFTEIGLVHKFESGKYSVCQHGHEHEDDGHEHMHIVANCQSCGKTYEVESHANGLCEISRKFTSYLKDFESFLGINFHGICVSCTK